jgi:hypothetical protein
MFSRERWLTARFFYGAKFFAPVLIGLALPITWELAHRPVGDPIYLVGTVRSTGVVAVSRLAGGNALAAVVELRNGRTVTVLLSHMSDPVRQGQTVKVWEQHLVFAAPEYGIAQE